MNYNEFDTTQEFLPTSQYNQLQLTIIDALKTQPLKYYDLYALIPDVNHYKYLLSGQLQYLKKKGVIQLKKFGLQQYWGLTKTQRSKNETTK